MQSENFTRQAEEIEALSSIYGDDWSVEDESTRTFQIRIVEHRQEAVLRVTMAPDYPSLSPPRFDLSAPWMDRRQKTKLIHSLNDVYLEHVGQPVIYQWAEKVREAVLTLKPTKRGQMGKSKRPEDVPRNMSLNNTCCPAITHGEVIVDRKSIFQGHAAVVHSLDEVKAVLEKLKENKKITNAKHNMFVYRIVSKTARGESILCDCDEDGEAHAGGRLLKLITLLDQRNTLVVVTRWYGGIQLGPDRFRHISNAMKQVIEQAGLLKK